MDEILCCYHSNETSSAVLSHGTIHGTIHVYRKLFEVTSPDVGYFSLSLVKPVLNGHPVLSGQLAFAQTCKLSLPLTLTHAPSLVFCCVTDLLFRGLLCDTH